MSKNNLDGSNDANFDDLDTHNPKAEEKAIEGYDKFESDINGTSTLSNSESIENQSQALEKEEKEEPVGQVNFVEKKKILLILIKLVPILFRIQKKMMKQQNLLNR